MRKSVERCCSSGLLWQWDAWQVFEKVDTANKLLLRVCKD